MRYQMIVRCALVACVVTVLALEESRAQTYVSGKPASVRKAERQVRMALRQKISLDFNATPLSEALKTLEEKLGVQCLMDKPALEDATVAADAPVTFKISDVTAKTAIKMFLRSVSVDLDFLSHGEFLLITTRERANGADSLETLVYPVRDLVSLGHDDAAQKDFESLIEVITSSVAPDSWGEGGGQGQGTIKEFDRGAVLVITTTAEVHESITRLLKGLRIILASEDGKQTALREMKQDDDQLSARPGAARDAAVLRPAQPAPGVSVDAHRSEQTEEQSSEASQGATAGGIPAPTP